MFQFIANGLLGILLGWPLVIGASGPAFQSSPHLQQVGRPLPYASPKEFEEIQEMVIVPQSMQLSGNTKRWDVMRATLYQDPVFADLYFDERRSHIQGSLKHFLQKTVALLEQEQEWGLRIEGHCDSRGTSAYNLARAEYHLTNLTQFFEIMGISSERIHRVNFGQDPFSCQSLSERCQEDNLRAKQIFSMLAVRQSQRGCVVRLRFEAGNDWDRAMRYSRQSPYLQRIQVATPLLPPPSSSFLLVLILICSRFLTP